MEFKIVELTDKNIDFIKIDKAGTFASKIKGLTEGSKVNFMLDYDDLNLDLKLYGSSKEESKKIQAFNANIVLEMYGYTLKAVKLALKLKLDFDGQIFVENLQLKKNNNDFLISAMLDIDLNKGNKYEKIISHASDFLNYENIINNMCDFKDNKCVSCRERNIDRVIGCCQKNCKFTHTGTCTVKNIACKLYMCDYIENKGYYFSPYHHPILKRYFSLVQRFACKAVLFKSLETQVKIIKASKFVPYALLLILIGYLAICLI